MTDLQNGTYKVIYKGLPKYAGTPDQLITYTLTEGAIDKYTADKTSFSGTTKADVIAGTITNTHATLPPAASALDAARATFPLRQSYEDVAQSRWREDRRTCGLRRR